MANPTLQIGNNNWAIKKDNLLGYSTIGTNFLPKPITMTRASAGTRVNYGGFIETVELLGPELVTNGDFANGTTGWTVGNGWNVTNNRLNIDTDDGSESFRQLSILEVGKTYVLTLDVSLDVGSIKFESNEGANFIITTSDTIISHTFVADSTAIIFRRNVSPTRGYIDNISVKESTRNNLARINYDNTVSSLLVEPQRTNLLTYSEDFTDTYWSSSTDVETPVKSTTIKSPDGYYNAWHIVKNGSNSKIAKVIGSSSVEYSKSIWARTISGSGTAYFGNGSIGNGVLTTVTTEWQRIEITSSVHNFYAVDFRVLSTLTEVLIWGAQMEEGAYTTSYIPTIGSTVTRVADQYTKTGISNLINSAEGVLFVEIAALSDDNTDRRITLTDGTLNNYVSIGFSRFTGNINREIVAGGVVQHSGFGATGVTQTNNNKFALSWGGGAIKFYINGSLTNSTTLNTPPTGLNSLKFSAGNNTLTFFGKVKQLQVFDTILTDTELATLTTI